jgi:hypothetical protein
LASVIQSEVHFTLSALAQWSNTRLVNLEIKGLNPPENRERRGKGFIRSAAEIESEVHFTLSALAQWSDNQLINLEIKGLNPPENRE